MCIEIHTNPMRGPVMQSYIPRIRWRKHLRETPRQPTSQCPIDFPKANDDHLWWWSQSHSIILNPRGRWLQSSSNPRPGQLMVAAPWACLTMDEIRVIRVIREKFPWGSHGVTIPKSQTSSGEWSDLPRCEAWCWNMHTYKTGLWIWG